MWYPYLLQAKLIGRFQTVASCVVGEEEGEGCKHGAYYIILIIIKAHMALP